MGMTAIRTRRRFCAEGRMDPQTTPRTLLRLGQRFALRFALQITLLTATLLAGPAQAGTLTRAQLDAMFAPLLTVGEINANLPVWPVFRRGGDTPVLQAYAFETSDIEPVSGYGGKPINLLVVMDPQGAFLQVRLLSHTEPIFRSEKGTATLAEFASQYNGLSMNHNIQILSPKAQTVHTESTATLHGIVAGTVTAMAINKSIMEAAAQVAQARLDDPQARSTAVARSGPDDRYQRTGWNALASARLVQPFALSQREVETRFAGTPGAGRDAEGMLRPDTAAVDLWVAVASLPQAGRNLLDAAGWAEVRALREQGTAVLLVLDGGRYPLQPPPAAAGPGTGVHPLARSSALALQQGGRAYTLRELPYQHGLRLSGQYSGVTTASRAHLFAVLPAGHATPFNLTQPMRLELQVRRSVGQVGHVGGAGGASGDSAGPAAPEPSAMAVVEFSRSFAVPDADNYRPVPETPGWWLPWQQRRVELAVLATGLLVLSIALARQRWLVAVPRRLALFRTGYLLFTLVTIGWWAQGQLTIISATALIEALRAGRNADFLLADPIAVVLWAYTGVTLLVWGRGTFCGWLCPFGALQELLAKLGAVFGFRARRLHRRLDARLKWLKYGVLALLLGTAAVASPFADQLVEIEPFKTSISLLFQREWPYVVWAGACLALGGFVYRGFCRYLCPLGAGLAVLGRVRLLDWIPRRAECGTPCQTCRHSCDYQAIAPAGKVDYDECFQCLDCVEIHDNAARCLPLVRQRKYPVIEIQQALQPALPTP